MLMLGLRLSFRPRASEVAEAYSSSMLNRSTVAAFTTASLKGSLADVLTPSDKTSVSCSDPCQRANTIPGHYTFARKKI